MTAAEEVQQTLTRVLADDQITVTPVGSFTSSPPSPLNPEIMQAGRFLDCGDKSPQSLRGGVDEGMGRFVDD